ncbi:pyroglutamyl-peptidase I [Adhaeretor mobilis]|uniref:Pyrrolidone-carboxylate peptidase n=1 Tax=Adhaeretor mobilis TaxID=1930276 RepID=A0A517MV26_9BACT|nr:pyroglutamyl-peptidase I [Adhaeretor mobilis]QDS98728.1 Pyrrolidone-carboxylate peptidase [Adhaeretor mobilis]
MTRILLTAFDAYESWTENASWLLVQRLLRDLPSHAQVTTRLYPVEFSTMRERLAKDLQDNYDVVLMLGQAPGYGGIEFEAIGLNIALPHGTHRDEAGLLAEDGPVAYRSELPLGDWARDLRQQGVPAQVSFHAGSFLCNAALYLAHYYIEKFSLPTEAAFIHVPLDVSQVAGEVKPPASLPVEISAAAIGWVVETLGARTIA